MPTSYTARARPTTAYTIRTRPTSSYSGRTEFLLQEDGDFLLMEDGGFLMAGIVPDTVYTNRVRP